MNQHARSSVGLVLAAFAVASSLLVSPVAAQTFSDSGFTSELVTTLPAFKPVGLTWAPDGRLFIWQKDGVVRIFKNGALLPTPFIDISAQVNTYVDRGALGLALHPDFASNGYVYLLFAREEGGNPNDSGPKVSRLIRVTTNPSNPDVALPGSEVILLGSIGTPPCSSHPAGSDCIPSDSNTHSIGTLRFASDGKLFVGNGDGADAGGVDPKALRSQDLNTYSGKILRINDDGTAPGDNPFDDGTNSIRSKVWAYGLRNPYRFTLDSTTGDVLLGDVGWDTWEEADRVSRGLNYGWPCYEGFLAQPVYSAQLGECGLLPPGAVTAPLVAWAHDDASPGLPGYDPGFLGDAAIGGPVYTGAAYPETFRGSYFYADYVMGWIRRLVFEADGHVHENTLFATDLAGIVSLEQGPDGDLYYVLFPSGQIRRIRFNGPVARATVAPGSGYSPLSVNFTGNGSLNPGGGTLTYLWEFGDGQTSTLANPPHTYTAPTVTTYTARLTVTDTSGKSSSATVPVTVGSLPPTPLIVTPTDGTGFQPGQVVAYQGSASDPDEVLGSSALSWTVLLHHNDHIHTMLESSGATGSFVAQYHGATGTYSYELRLTATDSSGLANTTAVMLSVLPESTAPSAPTGLSAVSNGTSRVDLAWIAASDNAGVVGYRIERCAGVSCTAFVEIAAPPGAATSFSDTGLSAATIYRYRVRAADGSGNLSSYSGAASTGTAVGSGLLAAYALDEGVGPTVADSSFSGNSATITGAVWQPAGKTGSALEFGATSHFALVGSSSTLDTPLGITLEAWVYPTVAQSGWRAVIQRQTDSYFLHASSAAGSLRPAAGGIFNGAVDYVSSPTSIPVGTWSHLAFTWNGSTMRLYVNGAEVAAKSRTGTMQTTASGAGPIRIGNNSPYLEDFLGRIDDVRIYDVPRGAALIAQDMNTAVPPAPDTTPPTTPASLVATASGLGRIDLTWTASTDQPAGSGVAGYEVERCQGAGCTGFAALASSTTNAFADTGLANATTYRYRVLAVDGAGNSSGTSSSAAASTPSTSGGTGPVAAFAFGEGAGSSVADASGNANTGTITGATWNGAGKYGNSLTFDGTGHVVLVPNSTSLDLSTGMTLEAWVYPTTSQTGWRAVIQRQTDAFFLHAGSLAGALRPAMGGTFNASVDYFSAPSSLPVGVWSHLAATWDGVTMRLYVNGIETASRSRAGTLQGTAAGAGAIRIGNNTPYGERFIGRIDEVRIYNRALSTAELAIDMATPIGADATAPTAPAALGATAIGPSQIDLSWTASTDSGGSGLAGYRVERCEGASCSGFVEIASPATNAFADTGLAAATTYRYRVRALDGAGNPSGYSNEAQATTYTPPATALGQLAASMAPGTWAELPTLDMVPTLVADGRGGSILDYAEDGAWDPGSEQFLFIGCDHPNDVNGDLARFVAYSAATNTWRIMPTPYWIPTFISHGYDHNAIDPVHSIFYHRTFASRDVFRYDIAAGTWSQLPTIPTEVMGYATCCMGLEYFPELNGLILAGSTLTGVPDEAYFYSDGTAQWSRIASDTPMGTYNHFVEYNPVHKLVLYGGGSDNRQIYSISATGVVTPHPDAPIPLGVQNAIVTVDPVGGDFLVLGKNGEFYSYDVLSETWTALPGSVPVFSPVREPTLVWQTLATPVSSYGVVMFVKFYFEDPVSQAWVYLYKHTASTDTTPPTDPTSLGATATSASDMSLTWTASTDTGGSGLAGYRIERCQGATCTDFVEIGSPTMPVFADSGLVAETTYRYRVRAMDGAGNPSDYSNVANATTPPVPTGPPGVPDGTSGPAMTVYKNDAAGDSLTLYWDTASCSGATDYHVVYGGGSQIPTSSGGVFGIGGTVCSASPPYAWDSPTTTIDPSGLVWWIVVASDTTPVEGSWGVDGAGVERSGPGPGGSSGSCGTLGKSLANSCGR